MGRAVTFDTLSFQPVATGVSEAAITTGDVEKMAAKFIQVAPKATLNAAVPEGSDAYLFLLEGSGHIAVGGAEEAINQETFAAIREKENYTLSNPSAKTIKAVFVLAPPPGSQSKHQGLSSALAVMSRANAPTFYVADQKKNRRYFVSKEAAKTERGHAMIVEYEKDTETVMHHHPNAESMFVPLTGNIRFVVNGEPIVLKRGQAVYFPINDRHALRCAEGTTSASFLEFHIPGAFTTVKEQK